MAALVQITSNPVNQIVSAGQTASFSIAASGVGTIYYFWQTDNDRILGQTALEIQRTPSFWPINTDFVSMNEPPGVIPGATSSSYTTPVLQASDSGSQFRCYVIQTLVVSQSIGGPTLTNVPAETQIQTFSFAISPAVTVTVT